MYSQIFLIVLLCLGGYHFAYADNGVNIAKRVGYDAGYIITAPLRMNGKSIQQLLLFSGITYVLMEAVDSEVREGLTRLKYEEIGEVVEPLGVSDRKFWASVGALSLYGMTTKDTRAKKTAMLLSESVLFNTTLTKFFKDISGRPRPLSPLVGDSDEFYPFSGQDAFPSGHTSTAFTIATVISNQYPFPWVKGTTYTIAGLVGLQRLNANVHSLSDVFAGAVLGMWVGNTICSLDKKWDKGDVQVSFNGIKIGYKF